MGFLNSLVTCKTLDVSLIQIAKRINMRFNCLPETIKQKTSIYCLNVLSDDYIFLKYLTYFLLYFKHLLF